MSDSRTCAALLCLGAIFAGCDTGHIGDGPLDGALALDASAGDSGAPDASVVDSGVPDASVSQVDAGVVDAGSNDAGVVDAGLVDAGSTDAGLPDASVRDSGVRDAGSVVRADAGFPAWLVGVAVDEWKEIPNSSMSVVPAGMPAAGTNPAYRMDAWNGYALKGTDVFSVRQGGHGDYFGNEVLRFDLGSDSPHWEMIKGSSPETVVTDNSSRYTDGSPAAVHGYHSQRYVAQRDWVMSVGTTAMSRLGGTNSDCVVYDVQSNSYLPRDTVPDMPPVVLAEFGVWDDPETGDLYQTGGYQIHRWNQATNTWTVNLASVPDFYGFASVCCTDTTRRRALLLAGDPAKRTPQLFTFATAQAESVTPTGDLTIVNSGGHYGMVYSPVTDRFYAMTGGEAGAGLFEIHPTTFAIAPKVTTGGAQLPASNPTGVFTKFLYVRSLGGIVYFPKYSANAWFLRLH